MMAAVVAAGGLLSAAPAHAATINVTDADCTSGSGATTGTAINADPGDVLVFTNLSDCHSSLVPKSLVTDRTSIDADASGGVNDSGSSAFSWIIATNTSSNPFTKLEVTVAGRSGTIILARGGDSTSWDVSISGSTPSPSPGPVSQPAPVEVSLSLDLATSDASCTEGSAATGVAGAWLTLPGADDCSSVTNPDANLLGWSTSANFPVELAQSQVDKGWGAIDDTFDGVRMIFIPAGQATFVSGPNSLHPIWAS